MKFDNPLNSNTISNILCMRNLDCQSARLLLQEEMYVDSGARNTIRWFLLDLSHFVYRALPKNRRGSR